MSYDRTPPLRGDRNDELDRERISDAELTWAQEVYGPARYGYPRSLYRHPAEIEAEDFEPPREVDEAA